MSGLRTWILANLFAQDFIWARLGLSLYCWDGKVIFWIHIHISIKTSISGLRWLRMISMRVSLAALSLISIWCVCPPRPGDRRARTWWDPLSSQLDWTGAADSLNGARQRSAIKSDFSQSPFSFRVLSQFSVTCSWPSLPGSSQWAEMSLEASRDAPDHKT